MAWLLANMASSKLLYILTTILVLAIIQVSATMKCDGSDLKAKKDVLLCNDGNYLPWDASDCAEACHCEGGDVKCSASNIPSDCGVISDYDTLENACRVGPNFDWKCDCSDRHRANRVVVGTTHFTAPMPSHRVTTHMSDTSFESHSKSASFGTSTHSVKKRLLSLPSDAPQSSPIWDEPPFHGPPAISYPLSGATQTHNTSSAAATHGVSTHIGKKRIYPSHSFSTIDHSPAKTISLDLLHAPEFTKTTTMQTSTVSKNVLQQKSAADNVCAFQLGNGGCDDSTFTDQVVIDQTNKCYKAVNALGFGFYTYGVISCSGDFVLCYLYNDDHCGELQGALTYDNGGSQKCFLKQGGDNFKIASIKCSS